jgi:arylsulfatase A-like enzyme
VSASSAAQRLPALLVALLPAVQAEVPPERPPSIVLLLADDAGYTDFGFQADAEPDVATWTPRIDSIARDGLTFSAAYAAAPSCSPSRAGLLTGRYQTRFGHEENPRPDNLEAGLPVEETTMADRLKPLGYRTGLVGKWHLGLAPRFHPTERGFDWFHGLLGSSRWYFPLRNPTVGQALEENGERLAEEGYLTDRLGDAAVHFIDAHAEEPFFLMVAFTAPHGPHQTRPEDLPDVADVPSSRRRFYLGVVRVLDANVGKILDALERNGIAEETLVVFTNDNGPGSKSAARGGVLRGTKGTLREAALRVPMALRWPDRVEAGRVVDDPVVAFDLLPTFLAAAGGTGDEALDGVDLGPLLAGAVDRLEPRPLFWRRGGARGEIAVRLGRHKLHLPDRFEQRGARLYDLATDPGEAHDRASRRPEIVTELRGLLKAWEAEQIPPRWYWRRPRNR